MSSLAVAAQKELINCILCEKDLELMRVPSIEKIRLKLWDLMNFVSRSDKIRYETNVVNRVTGYEENAADMCAGFGTYGGSG